MKHTYFSPEMKMIGVAHEDILCTSGYEFIARNETGDGSTDRISVKKLLGQ